MKYSTIGPVLCALICVGLISACTSTTPHQNFKNHMQHDIGRNADDRWVSIKRYSKHVIGKNQLPNGNIEVKYGLGGIGSKCLIYFEVDSKTNIIVNWHFEGDEKACAINP
jgi:hypothetical protein